MNPWPRSILRLSGRAPRPAPEQKSDERPAAIFRRFFEMLATIDRRSKAGPQSNPEERA